MATNDWGKNDSYYLSLIRKGLWKIDKQGNVWSFARNRYVFPNRKDRYSTVEHRDKTGKLRFIAKHRLVYLYFKGKIKRGYTINHEDGNKANPAIKNLTAGPHSDNILHSYRTGLQPPIKMGEKNVNAKLSNKEVRAIRRKYAGGGHTIRSLGNDYGVSHGLIGAICLHKRRKTG